MANASSSNASIVNSVLMIVLIGLAGWVLKETIDNGKKMERIAGNVENNTSRITDHEVRIRVLERP